MKPMPAPPPAREEAMTEPPTDLWLALTSLPRPSQKVPFPRNLPTGEPVGELAIWPLMQEEQMAANAEADRFTKKLLKDPQLKDQANLGYHHTYTNEVAIQVLYRACRTTDLKRPAFPSPNLMRGQFSTDEIGVLFHQYCTVQSELGPIVANMSPEEFEGYILRLQAAGSAYPFDTLSWEQQRILVLGMASQLVNCWMAMFSAGLQPDVTTYALEQVKNLVEMAAVEAASGTGDASTQDAQESGGDTTAPDPTPDAPAPSE